MRMEIYCIAIPGLEQALLSEVKQAGFAKPRLLDGGIAFEGGWPQVWRANLVLRGASRILVRIGSFHAVHVAQLDKKARAFPWQDVLRKDVSVHVEAACSRSRIYHSGAAAQRFATAIREELGAPVADDGDVTVKVRIDRDLCTLSLDTSGGLLHKRGNKRAMAKAPLRETMAALLLRQCGYTGGEPVHDPFCGSGTIVIEAAEIAAGLAAGRNRSFAFEKLASFDAARWNALKASLPGPTNTPYRFSGSDRDKGAIAAAAANAERAGVSGLVSFRQAAISDARPPEGRPGLVLMNPPYGSRIGDKRQLQALYAAIGQAMRERFSGWRIGLLTADAALARATALPFAPRSAPILHGGLRVYLYQTPPLA